MRARYLAVAVGVAALVTTSAFAERGGARGEGRSSGHSSSGRSGGGRQGSTASSSRSGQSSQYRSAAPRYSSNRGGSSHYARGYSGYRYSPYRNRSYYGYRSYRPGFSLYLGSPYYYDSYYYGGYYPPAYAYAPAPYVDYGYAAPADSGYRASAEDGYRIEDDRAQSEARDDVDRAPTAPDSGRLRLDVRPADATIYVDDQFRGTASDATVLTLGRGRHTVEVARPGFESQRRTVEVGSGEARPLSITLLPVRR